MKRHAFSLSIVLVNSVDVVKPVPPRDELLSEAVTRRLAVQSASSISSKTQIITTRAFTGTLLIHNRDILMLTYVTSFKVTLLALFHPPNKHLKNLVISFLP